MREYNVVLLGPRGAGKTVYLGSLFHKLSTPGNVGYYLKVPLEQQKLLNKVFSGLVNQWPEATLLDQIDTWRFEVMVRAADGSSFKAVSMCYYDYAGGRLTEVTNKEVEKETQDILDKSDILLGLLDGEALYKEIYCGQPDPRFWLEDVATLCNLMVHYRGKSVHFVVSKWDLFNDHDSSLHDISKKLLEFDPFRNLVDSRKQQGSGLTRLIPVSSVGPGFAELKDGVMVIKKGAFPRPLNVEMPFACVLPDLIEAEAIKAQDEAERQAKELEKTREAKLSWWEALTGAVGKTIKNLGIDDPLLRWVGERAERASLMKTLQAEEANRQNREEAAKLRAQVNSEHSARRFVLDSMYNTQREAQMAYPSSKL